MKNKASTQQKCQSGVYWIVEAGDTLYLISRKMQIPLDKLIAANSGVDPKNLQIGSKICIPFNKT
ncbi:MAG TPA: LysM domain-containing protein [Desulfobacteria bacterium]|nr:LysM domain-containing protein [Desulfobacteria bacterium]